MYKQVTTPAIVLSRTNFNEVDRIVNFLSPRGQFTAVVKGVRKLKSKLVGGVELFSVSQITYLDTNSDVKRVVGSNLVEHYGEIAKNLQRMLFAYECMKTLKKIAPEFRSDSEEDEYYLVLKTLLNSLNNYNINFELTKLWWMCKLLELTGQTLELSKDSKLKPLFESQNYEFNSETARLDPSDSGPVNSRIIKLLRLFAEGGTPLNFKKANNINSRDLQSTLDSLDRFIACTI